MKWQTLIENQINKAKTEGQLENLEGEGKPLPQDSTGDIVSAGFRMMASAGVLPNEIKLKKAVAGQMEVLKQTADPVARKAEMRKFADLQMRLAIEEEARRRFYHSP